MENILDVPAHFYENMMSRNPLKFTTWLYPGVTLFTLFHNPTELRQKTVNQKGEKKSVVLKGN